MERKHSFVGANPLEIGRDGVRFRKVTLVKKDRHGLHSHRTYCSYWSATKMGIRARPASSGRSAFPITAPKALTGSSALMACPGVGDVVKRSPTMIRPYRASALQWTFPTSAIGSL